MKNLFFSLVIICFFTTSIEAQNSALNSTNDTIKIKTPDKEALKFNISEDGKYFFQITLLNQTWLRWNESNPGTTLYGKNAPSTFDIGLRRTRMQLFGQITDKVFIYFQFGQNNFNRNYNAGGNRKNAAFFHDAVCEYKFSKNNELKIGAGLTIANGLSRFSQPSIGTVATMDVPVFAQATVDQTDQFSRKLSIYARGQWKKFDYRFSFSDPFGITSNGNTQVFSEYASFATEGHSKQYQGYVAYQFFEHESHLTPYMAGTYLGKKKVLNIGGGFIYQPNAMWFLDRIEKDTVYNDMMLFSVESFLDMPINIEKGNAISAYLGYFNYNFGKGYLRYNGIMNPATGISNTLNYANYAGPVYGNAYPMFGTGQLIYTQIAYLLPKSVLPEGKGQLQAYTSATFSKFDRSYNPTNVYNAGINWLINGHKAKISLDYQIRPIYIRQYADGIIGKSGNKSCVVLQYQIFI